MQNITIQEAPKNGVAKPQNGAAQRDTTGAEPRLQSPAVDIYESADDVLVLADLPGVLGDDVSLHVEKDALTLQATRKTATFDRPVVYKRTFYVPNDLDTDLIEAKLDHGVLTVRLPRRASAKPRQITVKSG